MPLYPTEEVIWDENVVPTEIYSGENCLALPKLNLQFLTLHDYLLRNFNLFRLESTCEYFTLLLLLKKFPAHCIKMTNPKHIFQMKSVKI